MLLVKMFDLRDTRLIVELFSFPWPLCDNVTSIFPYFEQDFGLNVAESGFGIAWKLTQLDLMAPFLSPISLGYMKSRETNLSIVTLNSGKNACL